MTQYRGTVREAQSLAAIAPDRVFRFVGAAGGDHSGMIPVILGGEARNCLTGYPAPTKIENCILPSESEPDGSKGGVSRWM